MCDWKMQKRKFWYCKYDAPEQNPGKCGETVPVFFYAGILFRPVGPGHLFTFIFRQICTPQSLVSTEYNQILYALSNGFILLPV